MNTDEKQTEQVTEQVRIFREKVMQHLRDRLLGGWKMEEGEDSHFRKSRGKQRIVSRCHGSKMGMDGSY